MLIAGNNKGNINKYYMEDNMCPIENCYCKSPISYPKDCYDDSDNKDKVNISKDQYARLIHEIRCWENNIHLELNIGRYFKINNK